MKFFKRFLRDTNGTIAVTYALSLLPLLLAAGAAIDFARFSTAQQQMQTALDAGTMAAAVAKGKTSAERIKIGEDAFAANVKSGMIAVLNPVPAFTVDATTVSGTASVAMPTQFISLAGISNMDVGSQSEVTIPVDKNAEIALVLDYSGSMEDVAGTEVKYIAMRQAAIKLIDDLTAENAAKVKIALVPFSHHVYATLPKAFVLGQSGIGNWTGCTQDRQYPYNTTDATPDGTAASKWGQPIAPDHAAWGCSGYTAHNLKLRPLGNDFTGLKAQLASMTPYAYTHVALGVEFGYQVLAPNAPFTEGVSYSDTNTLKYMVVLTDGAQTEPAFGPGASRNVAQGDANLLKLCDNAKASGITMITVAFDLDDSSQRARLKTCASDPDKNFFVANTANDVAQAFSSITGAISAQAFLSK